MVEQWAPLRREDINDVRRRLPQVPPGRVLPLLIEILVVTREATIQHQPDLLTYLIEIAGNSTEEEKSELSKTATSDSWTDGGMEVEEGMAARGRTRLSPYSDSEDDSEEEMVMVDRSGTGRGDPPSDGSGPQLPGMGTAPP